MGAAGAGMAWNYWGLEMYSVEHVELADRAVKCLNGAFLADPGAFYALIVNRVPCNQKLCDDPYIVVDHPPVLEQPGIYSVGMGGVLAGIFDAMGLPKIATKWSDEIDEDGRKKLVGFCHLAPNDHNANTGSGCSEPTGIMTPVVECKGE